MLSKIYKRLLYIVPILAVLLLSVLLLKNSFSYSDLDLGWHLQAGNNVLENRYFSTLNKYNYTLADEAWVDHEWLPNTAMAYIYNSFGSLALQFSFLILALIAVYLAWRRSFLQNKTIFNKYLSFILLFLGIWASQPHLGIRVQELGLIGVVVLLILIDSYPQKRYLLYFTPILFLLWANLHASFLLGLALLLLYCGYLYLAPHLRSWSFLKPFSLLILSRAEKYRVLVILVLSVLLTLINPYGLNLYAFLGGYGNTFYMSYIREWQGQFSLPVYYPQVIYLSLSAAGAIIWAWLAKKNEEKLSLWDFGLFTLFFVLAWRSRRHFPLFVLVSLPLLTCFYQEMFKSIWQGLKERIKILILSFLALSLLFASTLIIIHLPFKQHVINSFCGVRYPCAAVNYLKKHPETSNQRLFSEYNWGGYLIWSYPEKKIFIDGRIPQVAYRNHSILEEYLEFRKSTIKAQEKLDEHNINLVLIKNKPRNLQLKAWEMIMLNVNKEDLSADDFLRDYLIQSDKWELIFQDNLSSIYLRK